MAFSLALNSLRASKRIVEKNFIGSTSILINSFTDPEEKVNNDNSSMKQLRKYTTTNLLKLTKSNSTMLNSISIREYSKKSKPDYDCDSDSDDEFEHHRKHPNKGDYKGRGNSEFWRRKMRTLHGVLDVNNDGVISFDDFMLLAKNFSDLANLPPATYEEFKDVMKKTWEEQWGEIGPYNLITAEQFLTDMHHVLNDKDLVKKVHRLLPYFFKAVDTDHTGYLNLDQYKLFFRCLGLTEEDAAIAFAVIDENGDGKLTLKEFVKLGKEYFLTEDERKVSRMFWGPLVNH